MSLYKVLTFIEQRIHMHMPYNIALQEESIIS